MQWTSSPCDHPSVHYLFPIQLVRIASSHRIMPDSYLPVIHPPSITALVMCNPSGNSSYQCNVWCTTHVLCVGVSNVTYIALEDKSRQGVSHIRLCYYHPQCSAAAGNLLLLRPISSYHHCCCRRVTFIPYLAENVPIYPLYPCPEHRSILPCRATVSNNQSIISIMIILDPQSYISTITSLPRRTLNINII